MPNRYISETERKVKFSLMKGEKMKTLADYKKEFEENWVGEGFQMEDEYYENCIDDNKVWQFIEKMVIEMLLEVQPDNMRQDAEPLYKIGYLEALYNMQLKKEFILGKDKDVK